jgi:hypothetical protein
LEDKNGTSPLFGILTLKRLIFALKRLSRMSPKALPSSREAFKAHRGTVVKLSFQRFFVARLGMQPSFA